MWFWEKQPQLKGFRSFFLLTTASTVGDNHSSVFLEPFLDNTIQMLQPFKLPYSQL